MTGLRSAVGWVLRLAPTRARDNWPSPWMRRCRAWVPELPRPVWALLGGESLAAIGSGLTLPFLFLYLSRVRGLDVALAGLAMAVVAAVAFVGNPLAGWAS